jgi:hypothetical protein
MPLAVSADLQYVAVPPLPPGWAKAAAPVSKAMPHKRLVLIMRAPIWNGQDISLFWLEKREFRGCDGPVRERLALTR